jgi:hypothetical protein
VALITDAVRYDSNSDDMLGRNHQHSVTGDALMTLDPRVGPAELFVRSSRSLEGEGWGESVSQSVSQSVSHSVTQSVSQSAVCVGQRGFDSSRREAPRSGFDSKLYRVWQRNLTPSKLVPT